MQVNHCKSPRCTNYGVAAEQKSVPGSNRYTLEGKRGISSCLCTICGVEFPLKSNIGIVEEAGRLASYLSPPAPLFCPKQDCANYAGQVPAGTAGAYASFGKTAIGNPRWRCNVCGTAFSQNLKATARQREPHKNKSIFKLFVNKMPIRRIIEVTDIDPHTFYNRLDFLHQQCQLSAARRERALANLPIRRLYLGVDRQDYLVNWLGRKDKRNTRLSAVAVVDNEYGYCFGAHLNFDPSLDRKTIQVEAEKSGDLSKPYPHRRFARLWLDVDHEKASAKSMAAKRWKLGLTAEIDETYNVAIARDDIESPGMPSPATRLPGYGMLVHGEHTMYGCFFFLKRLLGNVQKWRFFLDQDPGLRAACLAAPRHEIPRPSVSSTGHSSHILMRCNTRRSTIRRATDFSKSACGILPKIAGKAGAYDIRTAPEHQLFHLHHCLLGIAPRTVSILLGWKIGFKDRFQHQHRCCHADPIP